MALNDAQFKTDLESLYDATQDEASDAATAKDNFINAFILAVKNYITSASIVYESGLMAPDGAVEGTFEGGLK